MILKIRCSLYLADITLCGFFLFPKIIIYLEGKIWEHEGHKKKYNGSASYYNKRRVSEMYRTMETVMNGSGT